MSGNGARDKLRRYFLYHIGQVLDSDTLREVAGISEWARRVRELRNEEGYQILTHNDRSDLKPGQYLLENPKPQPAFAREISKETRAMCLTAMALPVRCAARSPESRILMTLPAKHACISGTSLTKAWAAQMTRPTCARFAVCVTRAQLTLRWTGHPTKNY